MTTPKWYAEESQDLYGQKFGVCSMPGVAFCHVMNRTHGFVWHLYVCGRFWLTNQAHHKPQNEKEPLFPVFITSVGYNQKRIVPYVSSKCLLTEHCFSNSLLSECKGLRMDILFYWGGREAAFLRFSG